MPSGRAGPYRQGARRHLVPPPGQPTPQPALCKRGKTAKARATASSRLTGEVVDHGTSPLDGALADLEHQDDSGAQAHTELGKVEC